MIERRLFEDRAVASGTGAARALAAVLLAASLAATPGVAADQRDPRLPELFTALAGAPGPAQALRIEGAIWEIWLDGADPALNGIMARGVAAMSANRLRDAAERFTELILAAPEFAEAWNKRATVYYLMDRYEDSVRDIERTLALEPRHFGAISGMGLIFLERGDEEGALGAFEQVLEIHPQARGARFHAERLRKRLEGRRIRGPLQTPRFKMDVALPATRQTLFMTGVSPPARGARFHVERLRKRLEGRRI